MDKHALLLEVGLLTDRYNGSSDWPPSPFRLFQALVAGAYGGRWRGEPRDAKDAAFEWLEGLDAPWIAAPRGVRARSTIYYVPNNDLDARGGDPKQASEIRVAKATAPVLFEEHTVLYAWPFESGGEHARTLCSLAERLHTLGRGVDAAFARAETVEWVRAEERLRSHRGGFRRPSGQRGRDDDPTCPMVGSLRSLEARYVAELARYTTRGRETEFRRAPKANFATVSYEPRPTQLLFELRSADGRLRLIPQEGSTELVALIRTVVVERLAGAMPERSNEILAAVEGNGAARSERDRRLRFVPLPSIGHVQASPAIRRVLIEVPSDCPIEPGDISWALSGQPVTNSMRGVPGEDLDTHLVASEDHSMLRHYGVGREARRWRTVTPVAVRIARPARGRLSGMTRAALEAKAARSIAAAARDVGLPTDGLIVHARREPFHARGARADAFRRAQRDDCLLVHAELILAEPVNGLIVLGDGQYDGLGLFRPAEAPHSATRRLHGLGSSGDDEEVARFVVREGPPVALAMPIAEAARLALMSKLGDRCPHEISGRTPEGPLRNETAHQHAFYLPEDADGDGVVDHLLIYCRSGFRRAVRDAMDRLVSLWTHAGTPVRHEWGVSLERVCPTSELHDSRLLGFAREWVSVTPYLKPRYDRRPPHDFAARVDTYRQQILRDWRIQFPKCPVPRIEPIQQDGHFVSTRAGAPEPGAFVRSRRGRGGHQPDVSGGFFLLEFPTPVAGPIGIGKHAHFGMGMFERNPA